MAYLLIADTTLIGYFGAGVLVLSVPIFKLIKAARNYMHRFYNLGKTANKDLVNAVENLPLIKILRMERFELENFTNAVKKVYDIAFKNYQIGFINNQLPNFFTLFVFSIILNIPRFISRISLDFRSNFWIIAIFSKYLSALNQVANSQIHIAEFVKMEKAKRTINPNYFSVTGSEKIIMKDVTFNIPIVKNIYSKTLMLSFKNTHNIIIGAMAQAKVLYWD